ncbi:AAA family ATPase [Candidatus Chloroploca sp. M-50]|uniref:AAA family ATPase n=1 Tax=Candidatus Chloroploca mongolica TaxID=2528176 RepID=A0ABS4DF76_9CHLR|nr:ATP-binding protein [Candidatus Chloroploca mongolica]MBP1468093.1 AAA family ATPase [Candidatus Chloroploca mongolica]
MSQTTTALAIGQIIPAYGDSYEHLADELAWLDLLIQLRVAELRLRTQALPSAGQQQIFITHAEVDALLQHPGTALDTPELTGLRTALAELRTAIDGRVAATLAQGDNLPLANLGQVFGLSPFELDVVLICLAPELERKYDRLYAYLQDDITRKKPSVDLVLTLLCTTPSERWRAHGIFAGQAPLFRYSLLLASDDPQSPSGSSDLARFLKLDPRIAGFLLSDGRIDSRLAGIARLEWPEPSAEPPLVDPMLLARMLRLVENHCTRGAEARQPLALHLCGPYGSGKHALALTLCGRLPCPLLTIDVELLLARGGELEALLHLACREGPLCQAALYLDRVDILLGEEERARTALRLLASAAAEYGWLIVLAGERPWPAQGLFEGMAFQSVTLPLADASLRTEAWRRELARSAPGADAAWAEELALRFRLTPGQICDAAEDAAQQQVMDDRALTLAELSAACRRQASRRLAELAQPIAPRAGWDDLVLPADRIAQLRELCGQVRRHDQVFDGWGFGGKLSRGRGTSALFSGPPGTGKTMAAEVIAGELGLELYKIDLSQVVSKYIGETEKNLQRIFQEAERSNAILFFDEADALFGKRTAVGDAHDRYANIETSYLLQRIEEHEGVVILASNLRENMDEAFVRRLRCIVEFPFPDEGSRLRIWQGHLPTQAPCDVLDLALLARRHQLAGGNIKNIVLRAAFLAANDGGVIGMAHMLQAARREYEQIGRLWGEG